MGKSKVIGKVGDQEVKEWNPDIIQEVVGWRKSYHVGDEEFKTKEKAFERAIERDENNKK